MASSESKATSCMLDSVAPEELIHSAPAPRALVPKIVEFFATLPPKVALNERTESMVEAPLTVQKISQHTFMETTSREADSKIQKKHQSASRSKVLVPETMVFVAPTLSHSVALSKRIEPVNHALSKVHQKSHDIVSERTLPKESPSKPADSIWTIGMTAKKAQEDFAGFSGVGININLPSESVLLTWSILHFFQARPTDASRAMGKRSYIN